MKKIISFLSISTLLIGLGAQSSPPQGITYQAVAIDDDGIEISGVDAKGLPILDKAIKVKFSILADNANGTVEYEEEHTTNTDNYGMFSLIVGKGTATIGSFSNINWASGDRFLKVELDINTGKGYKLVSTQQMMSVPYAMVSETSLSSTKIEAARLRDSILMAGNISSHVTADKDTSALNEIQTLGINEIGNAKTVNLNRNGGSVSFSVADEDSSSTNEIQTLSRTAGTVSLSRGGTINLPDSSAVNEIQTLSKSDDSIKLSDGAFVLDDDKQSLSINASKGTIFLERGGSIQLADSSASNELQALSKTGNVISLSNNAATIIDSDDQQLTLSGTNGTLSLDNGGTVILPDSSATNELQVLSVSNDTFFLSDGGFVKNPGSSFNWYTTGNTGIVDGTHFVGTLNDAPLNFKVNNKPAGRIDINKRNIFFGENSGISTTGVDNIGIGSESLYTQTGGNFNTAIGLQTMYRNTSGNSNSAIGYKALFNNTTGGGNTAIGNSAMQINSTGSDNLAIGLNAMFANTTGNNSVALGSQALYNNTTGGNNTSLGYRSLYRNTIGNDNTALGFRSLFSNTTGSRLIAIGNSALYGNTIGIDNIALGDRALYDNTSGTGNTAIGRNSLENNLTGGDNIAIGRLSLFDNTSGHNSVAMGYQALYSNTIGTGNIALGYASLRLNTTGVYNIAIGYLALTSNTNGVYNNAIGFRTLRANTSGAYNNAFGYQALHSNTTGNSNTAIGYSSLQSNTNGANNNALGFLALNKNTSGANNNALGARTLTNNTTGSNDIAIGESALNKNTTGFRNIAIGQRTLYQNTIGVSNTAINAFALTGNTSGSFNFAVGHLAASKNTTGYFNLAIGYSSLLVNRAGSDNVALGSSTLDKNTVGSNNVAIGAHSGGGNSVDSAYNLSSSFGAFAPRTASGQVRIGHTSANSIGGYQNWTNVSDGRFKNNVNENVPGLDFVLALRPVTYNLDITKLNAFLGFTKEGMNDEAFQILELQNQKVSKEVKSGFIAQEVEKTAKEMGYEFSGVDAPKNSTDHYGLRYAEFVVPMVKAMQEQQSIINGQNTKIETLEEILAQLKTNNDSLLKRVEALEK